MAYIIQYSVHLFAYFTIIFASQTSTFFGKKDDCKPVDNTEIKDLLKSVNRNLLELIHRPLDCDEVRKLGYKENGVYNIYPARDLPHAVYCLFEYDVGWTVVLHRMKQKKQQSFNMDWIDYRNGFGNASKEYWLGNEHLHQLTNTKDYMLRIDAEFKDRSRGWAQWGGFHVDSEKLRYKMNAWQYDKYSTIPNIAEKEDYYLTGYHFNIDKYSNYDPLKCKEGDFKCKNEELCIPNSRFCDRISDCADSSDEYNDQCDDSCKKEERCPKGNCTSFFQRCDDDKHCTDGSDEFDCEDRCSRSIYVLCGSGRCINEDRKKCNGVYDCLDHSDEMNCKNTDFRLHESDGTGGYWFRKNNLINPTDDYYSPYFLVKSKNGEDKRIKTIIYKMAPQKRG